MLPTGVVCSYSVLHHHVHACRLIAKLKTDTIDALSFQTRVEQAARRIQDRFRSQQQARSDKTLKASESSATTDPEKQEPIEGEDDEDDDHDRSFWYTTIFVAVCGMGFFIFRVFYNCFKKGGDSNGVETAVHVDGATQAGVQAGGGYSGGGGAASGAVVQPPP